MKMWMKYLGLLFFIGFIVIFGIIISKFGSSTCYRESCIKKAKLVIKNMDSKIAPCQDFAKFVCGNAKNYQLRKTNDFDEIEYEIEAYTKALLYNKLNWTADPISQSIGQFNLKCNDVDFLAKEWSSFATLKGILLETKIIPEMFNQATWKDEYFTIGGYEFKSKECGFSGQSIFSSHIAQNRRNPKEVAVFIGLPIFTVIKAHEIITIMSNVERRTTFIYTCTDSFRSIIGARVNFETMSKVLELEQNIAKAAIASTSKPEKYVTISLNRLEKTFPYIDWKNYFTKNMIPGTQLPKEFVLLSKSYLYSLKSILNSTPAYIVAIFMIHKNILEMTPYLYMPLGSRGQFFYLQGNLDFVNERQTFCEHLTKKYFSGAITSLIIEQFQIKKSGKIILEDIVEDVRRDTKVSIQESAWIDVETKKLALVKLKSLKYLSLSDDHFKTLADARARTHYYDSFCSGDNFLSEVISANKFLRNKNLEVLLKKKISGFDSDIKSYLPKVHFNQENNNILVPVGILQFPAFQENWPDSINYGAIGSRISTEFSHAFDYEGSKYDENGILNNWWSNKTLNNFNKKQTECSATNQAWISNEEHYNKEITGVKLAYKAYLNSLGRKFLNEPSLPGLEFYSSRQMFFISYANLYCSARPQYSQVLRKRSPRQLTLNILSQLKSFKGAFGCKKSDRKYLIQKCILW